MVNAKQKLGKWGEDIAESYLIENGYEIISKNIRTPYGEIDLIAEETVINTPDTSNHILIFVEVKTRSSELFGYPEVSITNRKINNLLSAIKFYFQEICPQNLDWRIDVISVQLLSASEKPTITHFINAVTGN